MPAFKGYRTYLFCVILAVYSVGLIFGVFVPDDLTEIGQKATEIQQQTEGFKGLIESLVMAALRAGAIASK